MRAFAILKRPHIRVLWTGAVLSSIGDYFYLVAVMWTAAHVAGNAVGLVAAAQSGASLAFAAVGGVAADRFDRRRVMIGADLARAALLVVVATLAARGALGLASLVAVAIVLGSLDALFTPSLLASIPALVAHPGELQATNALMDVTRRMARAVGPALAGLLAAVMPMAHFFTLDSLSFCASAAALASMGSGFAWRAQPDGPESRRERHMLAELRSAVRVVAAHDAVAWSLGGVFLTNAAWAAAFQVGGVLLASKTLGAGIAGYSGFTASYGAGNVVGNLVFGSVRVRRKARFFFLSRLVLAAGFVVFATAPSLPWAMAGAAFAAVGGPMGDLQVVTMLQTEFSPGQTGRVFSLRMMMEHAGLAAGMLGSFALFESVPVRVGISACAVTLAVAATAGVWRFRGAAAGVATGPGA